MISKIFMKGYSYHKVRNPFEMINFIDLNFIFV